MVKPRPTRLAPDFALLRSAKRVKPTVGIGGRKKSLRALELAPGQKRRLSQQLRDDYPKMLVSQVLGLARSTLCYQTQPAEDIQLQAAIREVVGQFPTYGYRRVTAELRRRGWPVNRKRVARLMTELGLKAKIKRKTRRTTNSAHDFPRYPNLVQGLTMTRPDQVWVADITYSRLGREFVYLAVVMDVFTRSIRGWHLGHGLDQDLTLTALERALEYHRPTIHHSDQGLQYAALAYTQHLHDRGVHISMADVGEPTQNGYAERLMRIIKEGYISVWGQIWSIIVANPSWR